jgi:hypothetical protein
MANAATLLQRNVIVLNAYKHKDGSDKNLKQFALEVLDAVQDLQLGDEITFKVYSQKYSTDPLTGKSMYTANWLVDALRAHTDITQYSVGYSFVRREDGAYSHHQFRIYPVMPAEVIDLGDPADLDLGNPAEGLF